MPATCATLSYLESKEELLAPLAKVPGDCFGAWIDRIFSFLSFLLNQRIKTMLIYTEVALADVSSGDHAALEIGEAQITGFVVATDVERELLLFAPLTYSEVTANATGSTLAFFSPEVSDAKVFSVSTGNSEVRLLKAIDSEASVTKPLTWERIVELEPKLLDLLKQVENAPPSEENHLFVWRRYKERLSELIGWERKNSEYPELRSSMAYEIVYDVLLNALGDSE
jgi:hypothetical protein